jgi:Ca2+-dependent lipid-binding protein
MSPYCLIKVRQRGDFKTDIMKGKHPKFNQVFIIEDIDESMVLELGLWDKETMKDDDFIGGTTINMKHLMNQQVETKDIPIKYLKG